MTAPRAPVPGARLGIEIAVRTLPRRADRDRYYREFVAELYDLPSATQLRHVTGFLSQAFALRAALGASPSPIEEHEMQTMSHSRTFLCKVLHRHHYRWYSTQDGSRYRACTYCHRESPGVSGPTWLGN
jgi:hypothetical protein